MTPATWLVAALVVVGSAALIAGAVLSAPKDRGDDLYGEWTRELPSEWPWADEDGDR